MNLFVYGTLQHSELMTAVAGAGDDISKPAQLTDFVVERLDGDVVPLIRAMPSSFVDGVLFVGLSNSQIARLDLFEGAFGYERSDCVVETTDGDVNAQVYLPPTDGADGAGPWSLDEWGKDHLQPMLYAVDEVFRHDPLPDPTELRLMWPMVEKRAWARVRAERSNTPATLRYQAQSGDIVTRRLNPPTGNFFRIQNFDVDHRQFDGGRSDLLPREVFLGIDAAMVLPYDPVTDHVLLVEQARMGVHLRGDPNAWTLEPIAGMTDARETPEQAARREAKEEADLDIDRLDHMFAMYPSPGSNTDYFECYCAPCSLPDQSAYHGGLDTEHEDLRIHILPLKEALALIDSGEITAGPLIAMLYWLVRHKDRYQTLS